MNFTRNSKDVELEPIEHGRADVLDQLFQLYAHDFSEHVPLELEASGRFDVTAGELWWTRADHYPFFVRVEGRLAGFALVRRGSRIRDDQEVMDVAEFFVLRAERRKRAGQRAAHALVRLFPGRWEVRVRSSNAAALAFWSAVLTQVAAQTPVSSVFTASGVDWHVLRAEFHTHALQREGGS
jgi:predicted acetyltransferase